MLVSGEKKKRKTLYFIYTQLYKFIYFYFMKVISQFLPLTEQTSQLFCHPTPTPYPFP